MKRTVSSEAWTASEESWVGYTDRWLPWSEWRRYAAEEGDIIFAPRGTEFDQWDEDGPSERAIIVRAIRETPELLRHAIRVKGAPSWAKVVAVLVQERDAIRSEARSHEEADRAQRSDEATPRQATYALKEILTIIDDS